MNEEPTLPPDKPINSTTPSTPVIEPTIISPLQQPGVSGNQMPPVNTQNSPSSNQRLRHMLFVVISSFLIVLILAIGAILLYKHSSNTPATTSTSKAKKSATAVPESKSVPIDTSSWKTETSTALHFSYMHPVDDDHYIWHIYSQQNSDSSVSAGVEIGVARRPGSYFTGALFITVAPPGSLHDDGAKSADPQRLKEHQDSPNTVSFNEKTVVKNNVSGTCWTLVTKSELAGEKVKTIEYCRFVHNNLSYYIETANYGSKDIKDILEQAGSLSLPDVSQKMLESFAFTD